MNCTFCQQPYDIVITRESGPNYFYWKCANHKYTITAYPNRFAKDEIFGACINVHYKNSIYVIDWLYEKIGGSYTFAISNYAGEKTMGDIVIEFKFHPADVTPDNIDDKLPIWLTFV